MELVFKAIDGKLEPHITNLEAFNAEFKDGDLVVCDVKKETRTGAQNRAIHVFCNKLAKALNEAGLSKLAVLEKFKNGALVEWSMESVKEDIWRQIQLAVINKKSTTSLDTKEVSEIYENVNRFTATRLGVSVEFPSRESLSYESER